MNKICASASVKKHLKETVWIFLGGIPTAFLFCNNCWREPSAFIPAAIFGGFVWVFLWKGNELISEVLDLKMPWDHKPLLRLLVNSLLSIAYTVLAMTAITWIFLYLIGKEPGQLSLATAMNYSGVAVIITIIVSLFLSARSFFLSWRQLAVQNEILKRESISSRYEALKQQVNPHFLFNSLNVLTNLVYEDQDQAARFIKQLSEVYRYVLDSQDKEVVSLREELEFTRSFLYLQEMRFGTALKIRLDIVAGEKEYIPPLSLQMLLENAIKHNVLSIQRPLDISVERQDGMLVVRNNLNEKEIPGSKNKSLGLDNIRSRYSFLSDRAVEIEKTDSQFIVSLPLLYNS